jgi:Mor family transcriptional regulator
MQVKRPRYRKRWVDIHETEKAEIFSDYEMHGTKLKDLSDKFNISIQNISKIISEKFNENFKK